MDQYLESNETIESNVRVQMKETNSEEKSNKCNQCNNSYSHTGDLRRLLKTHSGEKSNKCNMHAPGLSALKSHLKKVKQMNQIGL